jgi:hypothetical protein
VLETEADGKFHGLTKTTKGKDMQELQPSEDQFKPRIHSMEGDVKCETDNKDTVEIHISESLSQSVNERNDVTTKTTDKEATILGKNKELESAMDTKQTEEHNLDQAIEEETVVTQTDITSAHKVPLASILLPGQSEPGELPSTNLTSPEFTQVQRKPISSQKFPCVTNRLLKKSKKVKQF